MDNPTPSTDGDVNGWDHINDSGTIRDEQGHGTAIAGLIAAQGDNGIGVSGVMWRASLMSLGVLDNTGTGDVADAVEANRLCGLPRGTCHQYLLGNEWRIAHPERCDRPRD